jgi:hypothetical protein
MWEGFLEGSFSKMFLGSIYMEGMSNVMGIVKNIVIVSRITWGVLSFYKN